MCAPVPITATPAKASSSSSIAGRITLEPRSEASTSFRAVDFWSISARWFACAGLPVSHLSVQNVPTNSVPALHAQRERMPYHFLQAPLQAVCILRAVGENLLVAGFEILGNDGSPAQSPSRMEGNWGQGAAAEGAEVAGRTRETRGEGCRAGVPAHAGKTPRHAGKAPGRTSIAE